MKLRLLSELKLTRGVSRWLEKVYEFSNTGAKMLIIAWRELGFLDEGRYLDWIREGGMLESIGLNGEDDDTMVLE